MIYKIGFPHILLDNDERYLEFIAKSVESVDKGAEIRVTRTLSGLFIRVQPSGPDHIDPLIRKIITSHREMGLPLFFAKSLETSLTINFEILL